MGELVLSMKNLILSLVILFSCGSVLADISISEPMDVYNLGDRLYVDLGGLRCANNGNLDIDLNCGNDSVNMVRIPARAFASDEDQTYSIPYKILNWEDLGILNLGKIVGTCQIVTSLGGNVASSKTFEISDEAVVDVSLDKNVYDPGEVVSVKIDAVKKNGVVLNGFAEGVNASFFQSVVLEGVAEESFTIGETMEAGVYYLRVRAYDTGDGGIMNEGSGVASYAVNQVATSLVLSLSDTMVVPGNNFSVGVEAFDQSGVEMSGSVSVRVISPEEEEAESVLVAGEFVGLGLVSNSSVGTWKIIAEFNDLITEREFEVGALQKVDFDFEEAVLVVRNIGNVPYNRTIDVLIGENVMTLDLNIDVGDVRKFSLEAPMGNYEVKVNDGSTEVSRQVLLTGNAISVSDLKSGAIFTDYSFVWIFLIVVFGSIGVVLFMRFGKTRTLKGKDGFFGKWIGKIRGHNGTQKLHKAGKEISKKVGDKVPEGLKSHMDDSLNFTNKSPKVQGLDVKSYSSEDKTMVDFTKKAATGAEAALVLKGEKYVSAVVAISVKNYEDLSDVARSGLNEVVENFKGKGLVDYRGGYIFVVFNPLATRTYKNERMGVLCALNIKENLENYNKKFKDKVVFGIGVHTGDLVASKKGGKLKYTGIGNTISFAKRMSDVDSGKAVVSEEVRKRLLRELKVSKGKEIGEKATWIVDEVRDVSGDQEKLKALLKRQR